MRTVQAILLCYLPHHVADSSFRQQIGMAAEGADGSGTHAVIVKGVLPMTDRMRAMLRGAGSILDIYPDPSRYERFISTAPAEERIGDYWNRVGKRIRDAAARVRHESKSSTRSEEIISPVGESEERAS